MLTYTRMVSVCATRKRLAAVTFVAGVNWEPPAVSGADELILLIKRALETKRKDQEIDNLRRRLDQRFGLDQIVGQSKQMKDVFAKVQRAAPVDSTVLILGESGTGKELVAQALHHNSPRKKGPFVAVNCAAVPATASIKKPTRGPARDRRTIREFQFRE